MNTAHTPKAHDRDRHGDPENCGCAVEVKLARFVCRYCAAAYDGSVEEFAVFCCYDCKAGGRRTYRPFSQSVDGPLFNKTVA